LEENVSFYMFSGALHENDKKNQGYEWPNPSLRKVVLCGEPAIKELIPGRRCLDGSKNANAPRGVRTFASVQ
jgi:hypothetical protein